MQGAAGCAAALAGERARARPVHQRAGPEPVHRQLPGRHAGARLMHHSADAMQPGGTRCKCLQALSKFSTSERCCYETWRHAMQVLASSQQVVICAGRSGPSLADSLKHGLSYCRAFLEARTETNRSSYVNHVCGACSHLTACFWVCYSLGRVPTCTRSVPGWRSRRRCTALPHITLWTCFQRAFRACKLLRVSRNV